MRGNRTAIVINEIPYQVNKTTLLERMGELIRSKQIEGITDLRDESDRDGMRIVIELRRGSDAGGGAEPPSTASPSCRRASASTCWRWTAGARA